MYPVLFHVGRTPIYTYSVLLDLGLVVALLWVWWRGRKRWGEEVGGWLVDGFLVTAVGGLVGGRVGHVVANWSYYRQHMAEILAVWRGGLSFVGALCGGVAALALFWALTRRGAKPLPSFWEVADLDAPAVALGSVFGWAACLASGTAYGLVGAGPLSFLLPDAYGIKAVRFATQPMGLLLSLAVFGLLLVLERRNRRPGVIFAVYLLTYFGGLALLEWTRGDETIYLGSWRVGQVAALVLAGVGAALLVFRLWPPSRREVTEIAADEER